MACGRRTQRRPLVCWVLLYELNVCIVFCVLCLQAQAEVLVNELGVAPEVQSLMRHIWFSLIPHTRLLDYDYLSKWVWVWM